jgi:hypothetical protein
MFVETAAIQRELLLAPLPSSRAIFTYCVTVAPAASVIATGTAHLPHWLTDVVAASKDRTPDRALIFPLFADKNLETLRSL